jgi:hypothetical protein
LEWVEGDVSGTRSCPAPISPAASAAAVTGTVGDSISPVSVRRGLTRAACSTRWRASPLPASPTGLDADAFRYPAALEQSRHHPGWAALRAGSPHRSTSRQRAGTTQRSYLDCCGHPTITPPQITSANTRSSERRAEHQNATHRTPERDTRIGGEHQNPLANTGKKQPAGAGLHYRE